LKSETTNLKPQTTMKKFLSLVLIGAVCALCTAPPARADVGTQSMGITNTLAASATQTTGVGSVVKVDDHRDIGLVFRGQGSDEGTGNITLLIGRSADGVTFETTPRFSWVVAAASTNAFVAYTNMTETVLGAAGYLKVFSIQNAATNSITNCSLTVIKKRIR